MKRIDWGYRWWILTWLWPHQARYWFRERLPFRLAWWLPRKVAYFAFIRVYAVLGECGDEYIAACRAWEAGQGR